VINALPLTIESLVAILLLLTILYCVRLNDQLKRLKADETTMQRTIADLVSATETAERAIAGLKATVQDADQTLGQALFEAEHLSGELTRGTEAAAQVLSHFNSVADIQPWLAGVESEPQAKAVSEPPVPNPQAIAAAARAFTERTRARSRSQAVA
jgi:hypothetical protein